MTETEELPRQPPEKAPHPFNKYSCKQICLQELYKRIRVDSARPIQLIQEERVDQRMPSA